MAKLKPETIDLSQINGGNEFTSGDGVSPEAINAPLRASAYAQALAENEPDITEIGGSGKPEVKIIEDENGLPKLKFIHIVGAGQVGTEVEANPTIDENAEELTSIKINKVNYKIVGGGSSGSGSDILYNHASTIKYPSIEPYYVDIVAKFTSNKANDFSSFEEFTKNALDIKGLEGYVYINGNSYSLESANVFDGLLNLYLSNPPAHPFANPPIYQLGRYIHKVSVTGVTLDDTITVEISLASDSEEHITSLDRYIGYELYNIGNSVYPYFEAKSDGTHEYITLFENPNNDGSKTVTIDITAIEDLEHIAISYSDTVSGIYGTTDKTLTVEDTPADAKATGEAIEKVRGEIVAGVTIESTEKIGEDYQGGNIYKQTFSNGYTAEFTAPKGERGLQGIQGEQGIAGANIESVEFVRTDENGGNQYKMTFSNGVTSLFTAPKGATGSAGSPLYLHEVVLINSSSYNIWDTSAKYAICHIISSQASKYTMSTLGAYLKEIGATISNNGKKGLRIVRSNLKFALDEKTLIVCKVLEDGTVSTNWFYAISGLIKVNLDNDTTNDIDLTDDDNSVWLRAIKDDYVTEIVGAPYVDDTLTQQGASADAKVVGDKFKDIDEKLENLPSGGGGTTVTVGGEAVSEFDADTKVDKINPPVSVNGASYAYGTNITSKASGSVVTHNLIEYSTSNKVSTIPLRGASGNFYIGEPTLGGHCATKNYVDGLAVYKHNITLTYGNEPLVFTIQFSYRDHSKEVATKERIIEVWRNNIRPAKCNNEGAVIYYKDSYGYSLEFITTTDNQNVYYEDLTNLQYFNIADTVE